VTRAELFDALLDEIAERVAAKLRTSPATAYYSASSPPPLATWRSVLEAGRRGELALVKRGRALLLEHAEYERWIAAGKRRPRPQLRAVRDEDADKLEQLGVKLGGRR
jgi:hypothetical protein